MANPENKWQIIEKPDRDTIILTARGFPGTYAYINRAMELLSGDTAETLAEKLKQGRDDIWKLFTDGGVISSSGIIVVRGIEGLMIDPYFKAKLGRDGIGFLSVGHARGELGLNISPDQKLHEHDRLMVFGPDTGTHLGYRATPNGGTYLRIQNQGLGIPEVKFLPPLNRHVDSLLSGVLPKRINIPAKVLVKQTVLEISKWWGTGEILR